MLGPLLFLIFINDLPELVDLFCKLFADDAKLIGIIRNSLDKQCIQKDLDRLVDWSFTWKLYFKEDECKVMDIGPSLSGPTLLNMMSPSGIIHDLQATVLERDLGIMLDNKLNWASQVEHAIQRANAVLGMLRRTFVHWDAKLFVKLFTVYVRPHLEYCAAAWNPKHKKDIKKLEQVQRRATKLVPQIKFMSYHDRLLKLGLPSLEERRTRGDLIQCFKFVNGYNEINWFYGNLEYRERRLSSIDAGVRTRGPQQKLESQFSRLDVRKQFFTNRVVKSWNELNDSVLTARSVNKFKNRLDKSNHLKSKQATDGY